MRIWWAITGRLGADLQKHINDPQADTMDYLIAGNLNQADAAFAFMESKLGENYTFAQFSQRGWSAKAAAKQIAKDIRENNYRQVRIFTISLGDHVARYLEDELGGEMEVYAINPCSNRNVLQKTWQSILRFAAPPAEVLCHGLGWISYLPFIPTPSKNYSLILLIDQYWLIYYDYPPESVDRTQGVICSARDEFLDNTKILAVFPYAAVAHVESGHGDTIGEAEKYLQGMQELLELLEE